MSERTTSLLKFPNKGFLARLFCRHLYVHTAEHLYGCGMSKAVVYKCLFCGKAKYKFL
jgi:hypothetical protein